MKCDYRSYEWVSVSPVEAQELECPVRHEMTSVKTGPPEPVPPALPVRDAYTYWQRRDAASQRALARVMRENRVRDECLKLAIGALEWYGHNCPVLLCGKAGEMLTEIKQHLAQLVEPEEETE